MHGPTIVTAIAAIPLIVAVALYFIKDPRRAGTLVAMEAWLQLFLVMAISIPLFTDQIESISLSSDFFLTRLDAAFMLLTAIVAACALTHARLFFDRELQSSDPPSSRNIRLNYAFSMFFVLAMFSVFLCKNLGYLWVCVESTTLLSAPLVFFSRTKHALEATWKYLIICSVGISFALLGTLFIFASGQHGAISGGTLQIDTLIAAAPKLDTKLLRFGFIFCLLGYGTKSGLFPLHSWLPDAHSEAPAPSSALLSGALLNCALFAIWRISEIVNASGHSILLGNITVWVGTITVLAASLFLIRQYALKRLLAYSSIEHVGMMLVAIGLNSAPLFLLQALNHSVAKVSLFLLAGNVMQATGKKNLPQQTGLMASSPAWAVLLVLSCLAGTGAPPFGTFISEWLILVRAVEFKYYLCVCILLASLSLSFIVVCRHVGRMILGAMNPSLQYFKPVLSSTMPALLVIVSLVLGLSTTVSFWTRL